MTIEEKLKAVIRDVPNFPKPGILFKDISTIMLNAEVSNEVLNHLVKKYEHAQLDAIAGIESRGFLFGYPLAMRIGVSCILSSEVSKPSVSMISCMAF